MSTIIPLILLCLGLEAQAGQLVGNPRYPLPPSCNSCIYCQGEFLRDVQLARFYNDSKTFVDLKLKYTEDIVLNKYKNISKNGTVVPSKEVLQQFVNENFDEGDELEEWTPTDFNPKPALIDKVSDPLFKAWVEDLNYIFLNLSRKVKPDVKVNPGLYSLLYVPNGFVIPGGRFKELYYWDTYWIVGGLLTFDMSATVRGIIENFIYLFSTYNIIPNGSRMYYLERSQPPLLIAMVELYYQHTKDLDFVKKNIAVMEKEFQFWMKNQTVKVKTKKGCYKLARYYAPSSGPRPESYREDYKTAGFLTTEDEKNRLYINLKSGAESGFDFSSRWFIKNGTNGGNLSNIQTEYIIPVELNSFLQFNAQTLSFFYEELCDRVKASYYRHQARKMLKAIEAVLWNEELGVWLDYDLKNHKQRKYFYLTNFVPLWTGSYEFNKEALSKSVLEYIAKLNLDEYIGGVPTSLNATGEQWDYPNAWPPLQALFIQGLARLQTPEANSLALHFAQKWLRSNYKGYEVFHKMFEKYDVELFGKTGAGGEYAAQTGFGWTNGVCLQLLDTYGKYVSFNESSASLVSS